MESRKAERRTLLELLPTFLNADGCNYCIVFTRAQPHPRRPAPRRAVTREPSQGQHNRFLRWGWCQSGDDFGGVRDQHQLERVRLG